MPALYVIATPIGNLEDITHRALRLLGDVDYVLAEDTRVTKKLLDHYRIKKMLIRWDEHSGEREWERIHRYLKEGKNLALVTDAGTPGISDPGGKLIAFVTNQLPDVPVVPLPGASALTAAISVAGIPLHEFLFLGFLPHKKGRQTKLKLITDSGWPIVLLESVHRIKKLLLELAPSNKQVIVCRELTKKFETVYRGTPQEVLDRLSPAEIKGEFVVIVY